LVVAAVVVDDLERPTVLLAARRSRPPALAGRFELPGGKVEAGESPTDALRRELVEELDLQVLVGRELPGPVAGCWPISDRLTMRVWFARAATAPTAGPDHDETRWLTPPQWGDVAWLPADVPVIDRLRDHWAGATSAGRP
jgi:8-oxo-dGTP diphosphatase